MSKSGLALVVSLVGIAAGALIAFMGNITLLPQYKPPGWRLGEVMGYLLFAACQLLAIGLGVSTWEEWLGKVAVLMPLLFLLGSFLIFFIPR
jgi:hypothetical protein